MSQLFPPSANTLARASLVVVVLAGGVGAAVVLNTNRLPWVNRQYEAVQQPVPFSHAHHVGQLGLECRYCHTSVDRSSYAGIPPTKTCMNCHSAIWNQSPTLEPVRSSFREDRSIEWVKVHDLPDFVYFNHSAHVNKGVGCSTCHGRVDRMEYVHTVAVAPDGVVPRLPPPAGEVPPAQGRGDERGLRDASQPARARARPRQEV